MWTVLQAVENVSTPVFVDGVCITPGREPALGGSYGIAQPREVW